ncbi:sensor domain-containing diguanylate cyclase [Nocardioides sp. Kera G14]|uniref:GGDEF domain-containing protein n=1 Tax=Nocardioides sp. Kera G14 TaxID=2884264 RepID=UPI001D0F4E46|nr:GGDEF domain-containing protein [Nocardioides sp. Kera G14]UDY24907.1 GGDEF domain-containing protein [Nocardioides sp. Kera G14]
MWGERLDLVDPASTRSLHAAAAVGTALMVSVLYLASTFTGEADATWGFYVGHLVVVLVLWLVLQRTDARIWLLCWPSLVILGLWAASQVAPQSATLATGAPVIAFLFIGLTQRRWTSLPFLAPSAAAFWVVLRAYPHPQTGIRVTLAVLTWAAVAEVPAWLTDRLHRAQRRVTEMAMTDELTGLPNRRAWEARLAELDAQGPVAVLLIDLDHFKLYNDEHGHLAGDRLLAEFAQSLAGELRATDFVARWGGEEFAVALPTCSADDALHAAQRIVDTVPQGQSCSIGAAIRRPGEGLDSMMERVDTALYRAKATGRSRVVAA